MANILVVDDEMGIRELLSEILYDEGHVVTLAENAEQARQVRQRMRPDLVLLDIWMPDTDGVTLLKEWALNGQLTMPVVMMSGHASIDTAVEATRIGALDFLEKPIKAKAEHSTHSAEHPNSTGMSETSPTQINSMGESVQSLAQTSLLSSTEQLLAHIDLTLDLREARDRFERIYFEFHLERENANITRVAERTGLERTHLYRKLKQLGIPIVKASKR